MEMKLGAVLGLLWVQICWVRGLQVEQSPSVLSLVEGADSTLWCNFSTIMTSVQWFHQNPEGRLVSLFYMAPGTKRNGNIQSTFNSKERYSTLNFMSSKLEDSGTYVCAGAAQCSQLPCCLAPNCSWACNCNPATETQEHCVGFPDSFHLC